MPFLIISLADFLKAYLSGSTDSASARAIIDNRGVQFACKLLSVKNAEVNVRLERVQVKLENARGDYNKQLKYIEIKNSLMMKLKKYKVLSEELSVIQKRRNAETQKRREKEVFVPKYTRIDESYSPARPYESQVNPNEHFLPRSYSHHFGKLIVLNSEENLI